MTIRDNLIEIISKRVLADLESHIFDDVFCELDSYEDFEIRYNCLVKSYKFLPDLSSVVEFCEKNFESWKLNDELIMLDISNFSEILDSELQEKFGVNLRIVGRSGGWWGINKDDIPKLVRFSESKIYEFIQDHFSEALDEFFKEQLENLEVSNLIGDVVDMISISVSDLLNYMQLYFLSLISKNHETIFELLDFNKLKKCLDFIDSRIREENEKYSKYILENLDHYVYGVKRETA